jgi:beta-glucosidase
VRAREVEKQMTDDERFSMIISVLGAVPLIGVVRDKRIPEGTAMSAGYTPGVPRLGVPALQSSDASMGITNPGYRPDDKGATMLPPRLSCLLRKHFRYLRLASESPVRACQPFMQDSQF